jgi:predicted dehydrogenase
MHSVKLGVIGLGLIWQRVHKTILTEQQTYFVPTAFCDVSEERRQATAAAFPHAPVVADYHELLQMAELEVIQVLTPIAYNAPTALAALEAGKDVIMEKPIARAVAEGQQLIDTARRLRRRLYITEQVAYRQVEAVVTTLLAEGAIGEVVLWERVQHLEADTGQGPLRYESTPWRKEADFPLGTLFDGGVHLIAGLSRIFGAPNAVAATGRKLRAEYGAYDQVAMFFHYANQVTGMVSHSSYLPATKNYFYIHGTEGVMTVEPHQLVVERRDGNNRTVALPAENAYEQMWQALVQAHQQGTAPAYTPERALQDVAILEAVDQAIQRNTVVAIPAIG